RHPNRQIRPRLGVGKQGRSGKLQGHACESSSTSDRRSRRQAARNDAVDLQEQAGRSGEELKRISLRLLTLALLATFCVAGVARADCGGGQEICWDDRFGLPPVADYAAEGDEVIRLHVESFGQKDVVYQLVRRPSDGSVWLDARADFDPLRTIFYPMSSDVWPKAV